MPKQPEGRLIRRTRAYLEGRGACVFKIVGGESVFQEAGIPDLLVCYNGIFIGLEGKTPVGKPSPRQLAVGRRIEKAGGYFLVFTELAEVEALLTKLDRKR